MVGRWGGTTVMTATFSCSVRPIWSGMRVGLVSAFGHRFAAVVGRDAGSPVAAYCALIRPDVFRSVAMMTSPFAGMPALPFNTVEGGAEGPTSPPRASTINDELTKLPRP